MSKEFPCKFCQETVTWPEEFKKGMGPVNLDGSKHDCRKQEVEPEPEPIEAVLPDNRVTCPFNNHEICRTSCALYVTQKHCTFYRE